MAGQWELQEQWNEFLRTGNIESPVSEEFAKLLAERVAGDDHRYEDIHRPHRSHRWHAKFSLRSGAPG
jgi:hypothetical protein